MTCHLFNLLISTYGTKSHKITLVAPPPSTAPAVLKK